MQAIPMLQSQQHHKTEVQQTCVHLRFFLFSSFFFLLALLALAGYLKLPLFVSNRHALHEKAIAQALELHEEAVILDKKVCA